MHIPDVLALLSASGTTSASAIVAILETHGEAALFRDHFEPGHLTASAFVRNGDRILLIHHDRLGRWLQPGGHIEPEDGSIEEAARREVAEETGLTDLASLGLADIDIHPIPAGKGEPDHLHLDLRWGFEATGDPTAGDGVSDARWFSVAELEEIETDESVLRGVWSLLGRG